jgi:peptide-methionine (S)-S-oxide reductase
LDILAATARIQAIELFALDELDVSDASNSMPAFDLTVMTDAEALQVVFDPEQLTYRQLIEFFYKMHDPTTKDRQGPDTGTQYRSGIFYHDEEQEKIAKDVTEKVQKEWWKNGKVVTEILPAGQWWNAEDYHQLYLDKNPGGYECPSQ